MFAKIKLYVYAGVLVVIILLSGTIYSKAHTIGKLEQKIAVHEYEVIIHEQEMEVARNTISRQNDTIRDLRVREKSYETKLVKMQKQNIKDETKDQKKLQEELNKDSSSDNQLKLIQDMIKAFNNV